jgi:hypothetical protein
VNEIRIGTRVFYRDSRNFGVRFNDNGDFVGSIPARSSLAANQFKI